MIAVKNGVPDHLREAALRLDRDRATLERTGTRAASRIGRSARLAALQAFERGKDPAVHAQRMIDQMAPLLIDAMVAGHLKGRARAAGGARDQFASRIKLRTAYDGAIERLRTSQELKPADISRLRGTYELQVLDTLDTLNTALDDKIRAALTDIGERGLHTRAALARLKKSFDAAGISPDNSFTLENLFRTHTQLAYSAGRWEVLTSEPVDEILWGFQYVSVGDDRVRAEHEAMDGVRLPKDDPFWSRNFPPNGFSCRCAAIEIFKGDSTARPDRVRLPEPKEIDGALVQPRSEPGFAFNPGELFSTRLPKPPAVKPASATRLINAPGQGAVSVAVREAMKAIDEVHGVPASMKTLPLNVGRSDTNYLGWYDPNNGGKEIMVRRNGPWPRLTTAHEIGHYLDHHGIGSKGVYSSDAGEVRELMHTIKASEAFKSLQRHLAIPGLGKRDRKYLNYATSNEEIFARSYAQYIATRSSSSKMKDELNTNRSSLQLSLQWTDTDFEPIAREFDRIFKELGWKRPPTN